MSPHERSTDRSDVDAVVQMQILAMLAAITRIFRAQHTGRGEQPNRTTDRRYTLAANNIQTMVYLLVFNYDGQVCHSCLSVRSLLQP